MNFSEISFILFYFCRKNDNILALIAINNLYNIHSYKIQQ
ncbi:hypothetical protein HMPREF0080_01045 [Anaeroglobus geminatus F0357]|uniref:Uncharacterized protein n=1 Tax=Anaeroglobus geminatus F0357 TaxID=861450 RepID=G9YHB8_9FIRM|nr:hypothetical protein HMPREF0080_01045 [Anaeroglobus geminatus F0357]